jgi:predicted permease
LFVFAALISLAAAVFSTLVPAFALRRLDLNETLKEGGRGGMAGARSHRARGALVIAEVAFASMAVIGAGLAVRSFRNLSAIDPGFDRRNVLVAHLHLSTNGYSLKRERQFDRDLRLRLESVPGIEAVNYADSVPLSLFGPPGDRVDVEGSTNRDGAITVSRSIVAPGYFSFMRIPLLAGRDFTERDDSSAPKVIIVNQTFARRYFGSKDPVGRHVIVSGYRSEIIGVVRDSKYRNPPEGPTPFFYGPFRQIFYSGHSNFLYIRAAGDLDSARAALRREAAALDPNKGLYEIATLSEYTEAGLFAERIVASLLMALGVLSLALAAVGLYSVMAYAVTERTHEIGIRMALGAQRREVLALVLGKALLLTAAGFAAGVAASAAGVRIISSSFDWQVAVADPAVLAAAAVVLTAVALLASYIPARRAVAIEPAGALRAQ